MSRVWSGIFGCLCAAACALPACAQYPGHIDPEAQRSGAGTHLRATAVLEYTGDLKDPKASRLIPIAVWDGAQYQPGALYLAQPAPLAVVSGTQYELQVAGQSKGFFNIRDAEDVAGLWIGVGTYQAPPTVIRRPQSKHMPQVVRDYDPDKPHFAHRPADENNSDASQSSAPSTAKPAPPVDPDRPTLHPRTGGGDSGNSGSGSSGSGDSGSQTSGSQTSGSTSSSGHVDTDPDRPTLHTHRSNAAEATAQADLDPDRPRLQHGKPAEQEKIDKADALIGLPPDLNQIAGISDTRSGENQSYVYSWSNPDDANIMKAALETIAQQAVAPPAPPAKAAPTTAGTHTVAHTTRRRAAPPAPALPALADEEFHAYGLSFGGGATMILTAHTADAPVKYITIVAQPDFYGKPQILLKQVTSDKSLDVIPRMRLVDAIDTEGNGRADLVFELRGQTFRQFAIYRVAGGSATQAFVTQPTSD